MKELPPRLERERRTVRAMVALRCEARGHHAGEGLCAGCQELSDYADARLEHCPFGAEKPTCAVCPIHCYRPTMRERMREAGPRMLVHHPILTLRHMLDERRPVLERPARRAVPAPEAR